jgi:hypothetical protein
VTAAGSLEVAVQLVGGVLALLGYSAAAGRCADDIDVLRRRARTRARAARQVELARYSWEAGTARIAAALAPLLDRHDGAVTAAASGFGDALVFEERLSVALRAADPVPADLGPEDRP